MAGRYKTSFSPSSGYSAQVASPYAQYGMPYGGYTDPLGGDPYTGGYNPYSPDFNLPNVFSPYGESYYPGSDIAKQYVNNRNMQAGQGTQFQNFFGAAANQFGSAMGAAGQKANQLYGQLEQTPGYTSGEANSILGNTPYGNVYQNLNNIDYGSNFLSGNDWQNMMGNPYAPGQAFNPQELGDIVNTANQGGIGYMQGAMGQMGDAYSNMAAGYGKAIDPSMLMQSPQYGNNLSNVLTQTGNTVMNAANRPDLAMNGQYASGMMNSANRPDLLMNQQYASGMMGAANNRDLQMNQQYAQNLKGFAADPRLQMNQQYANDLTKSFSNQELGMNQEYANDTMNAFSNPDLGITSEYGRQAGMTDQEVADTAAIGGQAVGSQTRAAIQDLNRQAAAQGNSSPLAVAAMRNQMLDTQAVNTADATVQAQLAARQQQREAATGVEQTRLGAQQYATSAELAGLQNIENTRLGAQQFRTGAEMQGLQNIENTRLGAQQYQTAAQMGAEQNVENTRLGAQQFQTGAQLGAMQNVENTRLGANQFQTQAQLQALQNVENTRLGANQFQTGAQMQGGTNMGQLALSALNQQEAMRLNANQYLTGAQMGAATNLGQMGQQNAMYGGNYGANLQQMYQNGAMQGSMYNQSNAYNAWANAEQQAAQRYGGLALNQQGVNMQNQANQFNRGFQTQGQLSGLNQSIANQRLAGQSDLRNFYNNQQQFYGGMYNQAGANLLTNRAQTQQGLNQATQGSSQWELGNRQFPSLGSSILRGVVGGVIKGASGGLAGGG